MANAENPDKFQDSDGSDAPADEVGAGRPWLRKKRWLIPLVLLACLLVAGAIAWASREEIADDFIVQELEAMDLDASYDVAAIGPDSQVLRNVVIGDPANPDLTIEEVRIDTSLSLFAAKLGRITLVKPRLYGNYRDDKLSFGALDPLIFTDSEEPFALPEYDLAIRDGRALMQTDFGDVGAKLDGEGLLSGGFKGMLAIAAPKLAVEGCSIDDASIYGEVAIERGAPSFQGPIRAASLACPSQQLALARLDTDVRLSMPASFDKIDSNLSLTLASLNAPGAAAQSISGDLTSVWDSAGEDGAGFANVKYNLDAEALSGSGWQFVNLAAEGGLRVRGAFERSELDIDLAGDNLRTSESALDALREAEAQSEGTLAAPLLAKLQRGIANMEQANRFTARATAKQTGSILSAVVPEARLRNGGGDSALTVTQMQFTSGTSAGTRLIGNFATSGRDLPQLSGRMEQRSGGSLALRLTMPEFREDNAAVSIPQMEIRQSAGGVVSLAGELLASGAIPGGDVRGLSVPVSGRWSSANGFALWEECVALSYSSLDVSGLNLANQGLRFCPNSSRAIVSAGGDGVRIGARMQGLDLAGSLGGTPFTLASGPVDLNWPGAASTSELAVTLGGTDAPNSFTIAEFSMDIGDDFAGTFAGVEARMDAVPMDILDGAGVWRYAGDVISIAEAEFRVIDRNGEELDRFEPLIARDASVEIVGDLVEANALLRHPQSDRVVAGVDINHNLSSATGNAAITVDGLNFGEPLQPQASNNACYTDGLPSKDPYRQSEGLSCLPLGILSEVRGAVTGGGQFSWNEDAIDSSGSFAVQDMDFFAAFGPVVGASGRIEFTDLINLTTAPNQVMEIASINPGVEVLAGQVTFEIRDALVVDVKGGEWPFMGGELKMEPVVLDFGADEEKRYIFAVDGLDAAAFVTQMELSDLSVTGVFDGRLPIVFDKSGTGRIQDSVLVARPPGGNVAYVGALSYEDMGFVSNFTFNMLKSLDFTGMRIGIEGPLTGILATSVEIDGVQQGEGASRNILTRELAKLPVQLNVNVTGRFYEMMASLRSLYDPNYIDTARIKALTEGTDQSAVETPQQAPVEDPGDTSRSPLDLARPEEISQEKLTIQLEESETMR